MIVRAWRFWTPAADSEAWFQRCDETALQELTSVASNRGVFVLWRTEPDETEFVLLSLWDDEDSPAIESAVTRALACLERDDLVVRRQVDARPYEFVSRGAIALTAALSFEL
jgi:hypothetical protein